MQFLGKDSIEYNNTTPIIPEVFQLMGKFVAKKARSESSKAQVLNPITDGIAGVIRRRQTTSSRR